MFLRTEILPRNTNFRHVRRCYKFFSTSSELQRPKAFYINKWSKRPYIIKKYQMTYRLALAYPYIVYNELMMLIKKCMSSKRIMLTDNELTSFHQKKQKNKKIGNKIIQKKSQNKKCFQGTVLYRRRP